MLDGMGTLEKITLALLQERKRTGRKFSVLTCYDAPTARLMEVAGVEVLLVGDTAGEVVLGLPTTREVPVDYMLTITAAVRRGAPLAWVMADLPYGCCRGGDEAAVAGARRFMDETGCDAVKVELEADQAGRVEAMAAAGVPVIAHIGLLPQSIDPMVGYRAQGRDAAGAIKLIETARRMEAAGAAGLLLEAVASEVSREITRQASVPVIGCVAGPHCDGTVVVLHDMLQWGGGHPPRAVKRYADLSGVLTAAFAAYGEDVRAGRFPVEADAIHMKPGEFEKLPIHSGSA